MTAQRPRLDDATEAYIKRVVATFPPFDEERKLRLSRLVTPPRSAGNSTTTRHGAREDGGPRAA